MASSAEGTRQNSASGVVSIESASIPKREIARFHLEAGRAEGAENSTSTYQKAKISGAGPEQNADLIDQARKQQEQQISRQEQLKVFEKQESDTAGKITELKTHIEATKKRIADHQAHYQEYKDSWQFWRAWTSEEDQIQQGLKREQDLLKAHEARLTELEKRQQQFRETKEAFLRLEETPQTEGRVVPSANRDRILQQLRVQSASLDNLMALDIMALRRYQYSVENDKPLNAWEKLKATTYKAFSESKAGRFVIAVGTIAGKFGNAVLAVGKAVLDPENWKKAGDVIVSVCRKIDEGLRWAASKIESAAKFVCTWENWKNIGSAIKGFAGKCYDFVSNIENWKNIGSKIADYAGKAWNFCTSAENWKQLGKWIGNGLSKAWDVISDPQTWQNIGKAFCDGCKKAWSFIKDPENWKKIGMALGQFCKDGLLVLGQLLVDPNAAWDKLCKSVDRMMTSVTDTLGIPGVWKMTKSVLSFVKGISDSLGITDIIAGAANLITMPTRILYHASKAIYSTAANIFNYVAGNISHEQFSAGIQSAYREFDQSIKQGLQQSSRMLTGTYRLVVECTGIADVCRGVGCLLKGDLLGAGFYFGMGAANLIALGLVIFGAGSGAAIYAWTQSLKQAAIKAGHKCLSVIAKEIGEQVGKEFVEKTGMDLLKKQAISVADDLVELCAKKGLGMETIDEMARTLTKDKFKKFLSKNGLGDLVENKVRKSLQAVIDAPSPRALKKVLSETPELAVLTKKQIKQARELLISGKHFDSIVENISKEITESIHKRIAPELEDAFAKRLKASLLGEVDTPAARKLAAQVEKEAAERGIPKVQLADEYVAKARKGFSEGLKDAIDDIVKAAVKKAIKKLKFPDDSGAFVVTEAANKKDLKKEKALNKLTKKINSDGGETSTEAVSSKIEDISGHLKIVRSQKVVIDGATYLAAFEKLDNGQWVQSSLTLIEEKKSLKARAKAEAALEDKIMTFAGKSAAKDKMAA